MHTCTYLLCKEMAEKEQFKEEKLKAAALREEEDAKKREVAGFRSVGGER